MTKKKEEQIGEIVIRGARTHNLKDITVRMPRNAMIVFTGVSGSGKSSLAFDTIFAEGQRRYVESLSAYARQFLHQMQKPDVDEIVGLSPAISIDQKSRSNNPRSTVATITEIYDYLRVLYARVGVPYSPVTGHKIERLSNEEIRDIVADRITKEMREKTGASRVTIQSPVVRGRKGEYYQLLYDFLGKGFSHVLVDGEKKSLREQITLDKQKKHEIDVIVDEIEVREFKEDEKSANERLSEAIERSVHESNGLVRVVFDTDIPSKKPKLGTRNDRGTLLSTEFVDPYSGYSFPEIEPRLFSFNSPYGACPECNGLGTVHVFGEEPCKACGGDRLNEASRHVFLSDGDTRYNIADFTRLSIEKAYEVLGNLDLSKQQKEIAKVVLKEIETRLSFMVDVGIEYLTLDRQARTLSGGEAQRIRLASQLGSRLVGALYVLDEPTIGLHQRDNDRLIKTLSDLRDMGNTIIIVEHDEDTIFASDYIVDIGPGAGVHGGEIVVADNLQKLLKQKTNPSGSLTLDYLRGDISIPIPKRRTTDRGKIKIRGGSIFNIDNLDVDLPLGKFICVTGVSGSGKSSLLYEILHKNLRARFEKKYRSNEIYNVNSFEGTEYLGRAVLIDQSPIGRTSRSNPATYTGAFNYIRDLFAETAEARVHGWKPGRFSFNVKGGRCEACKGKGEVAVEMHFLPTVYVPCDVCDGTRFTKETLAVKYRDKNISDVLHMTIEEALEFFEDIPAIYDRFKTLIDVGLGYLELGQSATTLSGGEAQRVKIASELYRKHIQKTIYLLDEPTVGLHYEDVRKLIDVLQLLVDQGNSVVVIEHNLDLVKSADYLVDLGPEGGEHGGKIVAKGTPEQVAKVKDSHTGTYLKRVLKTRKT